MKDKSHDEEPKIVVTGTSWMGSGIGSLESALDDLLNGAENEIGIISYRISGSALDLFEVLKSSLEKGVEIKMILNRFEEHPSGIQEKLKELQSKFEGFHLFKFVPKDEMDDLHAKVVVVDRQMVLVGSANLSWRGLVSNHEIGVILSGKSASRIGSLVDLLIQKNPQVIEVK